MNKLIKTICLGMICCLIACKSEWNETTKKQYMESCSRHEKIKNFEVKAYCECTYDRLVLKYEHPGKLSELSHAQTKQMMAKIGQECLEQFIPEIGNMMKDMKIKNNK